MNFFKGIVTRTKRAGASNEESTTQQRERSLCIQHLRKLFLEFVHPTTPLTIPQQELKQYLMLPLFIKAFGNLPSNPQQGPRNLSEKFGDVLQFAGHTSKLMVCEIQRRAANKTKAQASKDILAFLARHNDEADNKGWNLMQTLLILTEGELAVIECMVAATLQSILVKCIRLFFSLPANFGAHEKCVEVQKVIVPILVKLCNHTITAKELMRTDDLAGLFEALTCSCRVEHMIWRSGVSEVLTSITRNSLTNAIINYIHDKSCIALSLANIESVCSTDPLAVVEMFVTLMCVLKDSAEVSAVLLDSFYDAHGYKFLKRVLLTFAAKEDEATSQASRNLILLVASLVMTGHHQLYPSSAISTPFQKGEYVIPQPSATAGVSIRNLDAFKVLLQIFLETTNQTLSLHILQAIQSILNSDNANYFIVESIHPFAQFIQLMPQKDAHVKVAIMKLVEFIALQLGWVPSQELVAMSILFKSPEYRASQCTVLNTLILLINNNNNRYKEVLREAGLMDVLVLALQRYSATLKDSTAEKPGTTAQQLVDVGSNIQSINAEERPEETNENLPHNGGKPLTDTGEKPQEIIDEKPSHTGEKSKECSGGDVKPDESNEYMFLLMEGLRLLIEDNEINTELFRQHGGARCVHNLLPCKSARPFALRIIQQLIVDGGNDDLGTLLGLMHSTLITDLPLKSQVLTALLHIFERNPQTRAVFQEVGGFVYVVSVIVSLEGSLTIPPPGQWKEVSRARLLELIWMVFNVLTSAMKDEPINRIIFMDEIRFKGLIDTVKLLGCFNKDNGVLSSYYDLSSHTQTKLKPKYSSSSPPMPKVTKYDQGYMQLAICKALLSMATGVFENFEVNMTAYSEERVPKIYHPTAVNGLVELLPMLSVDNRNKDDVLMHVVGQVHRLMGSQVNQQLMCDAGLPFLLLDRCHEAFIADEHPLNPSFTKLFERLAGQSLHPKVLRKFLRLGSPLCSKSPYAVLRGNDRSEMSLFREEEEKDVVDCTLALDLDGTLDYGNRGGDQENRASTPNMQERNEFQTDTLSTASSVDGSLEYVIEGAEKRLESSVNTLEDQNNPRDERSPQPSDDPSSPADEVAVEDDERVCIAPTPDVDKMNNSTPVDRVESMLEDEEVELSALESCNFDNELQRVCDRFEGRPLPQNLVKSVVSLTTPREVLSTAARHEPPAFIEFDMNEDGYACLFVPCVNPQVPAQQQQASLQSYRKTATSPLTMNVSTTERIFPPPNGLSYSGWIYIAHLQDSPSIQSNICLLTVEKQYEELITKRVVNVSVFQIYLDLQSKNLVICTEDSERGSTKSSTVLHVDCARLFDTQVWHHVCIVLHKNMMRTSTASVYVDSQFVINSKLKYISQSQPSGADLTTCKTYAYIGTHPRNCHIDNIVWRLGTMALFEEVLTEESVSCMHALGPGYIGSFLAPSVLEEDDTDMLQDRSKNGPLISEDKILLSVNPHNLTVTTLLKLTSQCSVLDLELLASEMNISVEDKHTPIHLLPNSSLHLNGPARPIGLFFIGTSGTRIFCPNPVASSFVSIGGTSILLCLVAMVTELSELYAALKALTCILQSSKIAKQEMARLQGYKILAFLLEKKKELLNTHILHLVFSLVGTVRSDRDSATIPNVSAFNDVLCNLEIWHNAPGYLEKSLFSHFYELITQGSEHQKNTQCLLSLDIVPKLVHIVQDGSLTAETLPCVANVLSVLLANSQNTQDLLCVGQYLASTLTASLSEHDISLDDTYETGNVRDIQRTVVQRNALLDVFVALLMPLGGSKQAMSFFGDQICTVLGFDWLLLFLGQKVHKSTVLRGARMIFRLLVNPATLANFEQGEVNGYWLAGCEDLTTKKVNMAAGFNVTNSAATFHEHELNHAAYKQRGVPLLTSLLRQHTDLTEIYLGLMQLLLDFHTVTSAEKLFEAFNFDNVLLTFSGLDTTTNVTEERELCSEAVLILLPLIRKLMSQEQQNTIDEENNIPTAVFKFLTYVYRREEESLAQFFTSTVFFEAFLLTIIPIEDSRELIDFNIESFDNELDGGLNTDDSSSSILVKHPCTRLVKDLLVSIFIDQAKVTKDKVQTFTDNIFQSAGAGASYRQQQKLTNLFVGGVMEAYMRTGEVKDALKFYTNGAHFAAKAVDRLWLGMFTDSYKLIFNFILHLIPKCEELSLNIDMLYNPMNRLLLHQFSKPGDRITDHTTLLELLHVITANCKVVFSSNNRSPEFTTCLTHWLIVCGGSQRRKSTVQQHELPRFDAVEITERTEISQLNKVVTDAAERTWNVFYSLKKEVIEEVFGCQSSFVSYEAVSSPVTARKMHLLNAEERLKDQSMKCWVEFISREQKKKNEFLANPSPKVSKKLTSKWTKSLKREKAPEEFFSIEETLSWVAVHLRAVKALVKMRTSKHSQEIILRHNTAEKSWSTMELELIREGGIWGPEQGNDLEKWKLDDVEGPCRMRKRLSRNDMFYVNYPYAEHDAHESKHRTAYSHDSKLLHQLCQKYINPDRAPHELPTKENPFSWRPKLYSVDGFEVEDSKEEVSTQTIIQLLERGEKIYSMYRCARVCGLDSAEGLFLFGRKHFYVIDGFTLVSAKGRDSEQKEMKDISSLPANTHEPLIPAAKGNFTLKRSLSKWNFADIREVHKRRYLLKSIAIEVFAMDGNNHLLVFPTQAARDKVYYRIRDVSPTTMNQEESIAPMKAQTNLESSQNILTMLLSGDRSITQRWVRGEMTNFQYLMYLNTLAGRSYNDLMQYPIMPWCIADYTSEYLDLTNPATFRDLAKPMGAQTPARLKNYQKRYKEWEDPTGGKTPAYYYGTHYSSAMIVASYLIRLEPFTQHFLRLQGGHFDLPDRLFHSIKDAWVSASKTNMADVKELIPEFYYLPDFLKNTNKFDLGFKQSGEQLGDVVLPPWAKGDAREFIRLNREALESDYVSSNLHRWIDLVFGYRQKGVAAVQADNVFHHLFYENSIDLDEITDPLERKATIGFINNFGQMPKQLFKGAHPAKRSTRSPGELATQTGTLPLVTGSSGADKVFFHHLDHLAPSMAPVKELKWGVGGIYTGDKSLQCTETNKAVFPDSLNRLGWGYGDFSLRYYSSDEKLLSVFEGVFAGQTLCACCLEANRFVSGGTSTAVCVWNIDQDSKSKTYSLSLNKVLYGHHAEVSSLAVSKAYNIIVSGSEDKSCIVWDMQKFSYLRRLKMPSGGAVNCIVVNHTTGDIIACAGTYLCVFTVNGELLVHENTSAAISGQILCCAVSELNEWDVANVIITGASDGVVKLWGVEFYDASDNNPSSVVVENVEKDDEEYLLVNYNNKQRNWKRRLVLRHRLTMHTAFYRSDNTEPASVTALAISKDHRKIYVGDSRGRIYSWSIADTVGQVADHWVKDEVADCCRSCNTKFTFAERRHHCRNCGNVFCGRCSRYESPVVHLRIFKAVRVCASCYNELKRRPSVHARMSR